MTIEWFTCVCVYMFIDERKEPFFQDVLDDVLIRISSLAVYCFFWLEVDMELITHINKYILIKVLL